MEPLRRLFWVLGGLDSVYDGYLKAWSLVVRYAKHHPPSAPDERPSSRTEAPPGLYRIRGRRLGVMESPDRHGLGLYTGRPGGEKERASRPRGIRSPRPSMPSLRASSLGPKGMGEGELNVPYACMDG